MTDQSSGQRRLVGGLIHCPTVCPSLSLNPRRPSSLYEAFKAGNMHLSNVAYYSGVACHIPGAAREASEEESEAGWRAGL